MIDKKYKHLSVRAQCRLLDLNRSTLYAPLKPLAEDTKLANRIGEVYEVTPSMAIVAFTPSCFVKERQSIGKKLSISKNPLTSGEESDKIEREEPKRRIYGPARVI